MEDDISGGYKEAVDELEHLMLSLSNLFDNFAPKSISENEDIENVSTVLHGEQGKVMKIVSELNRMMTATKETKI